MSWRRAQQIATNYAKTTGESAWIVFHRGAKKYDVWKERPNPKDWDIAPIQEVEFHT